MVSFTPGNNFQQDLDHTTMIFTRKSAFENVACKMAASLSQLQYGTIWVIIVPVKQQVINTWYVNKDNIIYNIKVLYF